MVESDHVKHNNVSAVPGLNPCQGPLKFEKAFDVGGFQYIVFLSP